MCQYSLSSESEGRFIYSCYDLFDGERNSSQVSSRRSSAGQEQQGQLVHIMSEMQNSGPGQHTFLHQKGFSIDYLIIYSMGPTEG